MNENPLEEKIELAFSRIDDLEKEVSRLKHEVQVLQGTRVQAVKPVVKQEIKASAPHKPIEVAYEDRIPALAKKTKVVSETALSQNTSALNVSSIEEVALNAESVTSDKAPSIPVKEKTSVENKIGKNVMGIVAAILVFAALIVFGGMIYVFIPDIVKVIIMYGISFAFAIVGIKKMRDESKYKVLFSSIAGTGISALYISTLIAYFKFEILPVPVLIGIIIVWLIVTALLSKKKSTMFMYICNVGLVISTMLLAFDWNSYYFAAVLYILGLTFIYLLNRSESFNRDCHVFIQLVIVSVILSVNNSHDIVYVLVLFFVVTAIMFIREKLYVINAGNIATYMVSSALWLGFSIAFASICGKEIGVLDEYASCIFVVCLTAFSFVYYKLHKDISKVLSHVFYYIWAMSLILLNVGFIKEYISFSLFAIGFIIAGILKKKFHYLIPGYIYLFLFLCASPDAIGDVATSIIVMVAVIVLFAYNVKNYHMVFKFINTGLFIIAFSLFSHFSHFGIIPTFIIYTAISIFMNTDFYARDYNKKTIETGTVITGYVINFLMMGAGLYLLKEYDEPFMLFGNGYFTFEFAVVLIAIITIALFFVNTRRLFKGNLLPKELCAVYIGVKFTVLIINILMRMSAISFVISFALLVFAVICIVAGFKFKFKSIRLYGLVLTLICVAKLIIFDIEYDSMLLRPLGLLAAGLLCFGISWLYSRLEKQTKMDEKDTQILTEKK